MPFKKPDNPTMTTKDQLKVPVQVVSTPSSNENETNRNTEIPEVGHPIDFAVLDESPAEAGKFQVESGKNLDEFVTFSKGQHLNTMNPRDLDNFMADSIIARPVRLPERLNARAKDPNYRLRWIECKSEDGRRYNDALTMGFRNALKEEIVGLDGSVKTGADGVIRADDLILMIIPTQTLFGYYKYNALRSMKMVSKQGIRSLAKKEGDAIVREGATGENKHDKGKHYNYSQYADKLEVFVPGDTASLNR